MTKSENTNRYMTGLVFNSAQSDLIIDNVGWLACPVCSCSEFRQYMLWVSRLRRRQRAGIECLNCGESITIELRRDGWRWISHARPEGRLAHRSSWLARAAAVLRRFGW